MIKFKFILTETNILISEYPYTKFGWDIDHPKIEGD